MNPLKDHIIKAINYDYKYRILFYYKYKSKTANFFVPNIGFSSDIKIKIVGIIMRSIVEYLR